MIRTQIVNIYRWLMITKYSYKVSCPAIFLGLLLLLLTLSPTPILAQLLGGTINLNMDRGKIGDEFQAKGFSFDSGDNIHFFFSSYFIDHGKDIENTGNGSNAGFKTKLTRQNRAQIPKIYRLVYLSCVGKPSYRLDAFWRRIQNPTSAANSETLQGAR